MPMTDMMSMPRNTPKNPIVGGVRESEGHISGFTTNHSVQNTLIPV